MNRPAGVEAFTQVAKGVNGIVYEFDVATGHVHRTGRIAEIIGFHPHEIPPTADWWHTRIHPDDLREIHQRHTAIIAAGGEQLVSHYRVQHRDGHWIFIEDRSWVVTDDNGKVQRILGYSVDITEQRKAEAEQRQRQEQLRIALNAGRMGTWSWDAATNMVFTDAIHRRIFDIDSDADLVPASEMFSRIHKDDFDNVVTANKLQQVTGPFDLDFRIVRRDGEIRWLRSSSMPLRNPQGAVTHLVGVNFDITESRDNERRLRESTRRMSVLSQLADATRLLTDPRAIVQAAMAVLREALHADRCAWADVEDDENHFNFVGSAQAPGTPPAVGRYPIAAFGESALLYMRQGLVFTCNDAESELPAGAHRDAFRQINTRAVIAVPIYKGGRLVSGTGVHAAAPRRWTDDEIALAREVTERCSESIERARAEQEVHRLNARLQSKVKELETLLDILPIAVLRGDATCQHITGNRAGAAMLRRNVGDNVSKTAPDPAPDHLSFRVFIQGREIAPDDLPMQYTARTLEPVRNLEEDIVFSDGVVSTIVCNTAPLLDADGKLHAVLGVFMDISERKKTERAIRAASEAKDHFLAVLSHELRTPLSPVLTAAQLLESDAALTPPQRELAQTIRRNAELEARLIDDLLDLTRIARNKLELHPATIDLHEKIKHVLTICHEDIGLKRLNVRLDLAAHCHHLHADPARMQQIVWNLLKNAIKFTPERGAITVRTRNTGPATVTLDVADTGVGISPDVLPRIFDAFEQGGREITRQFGGMGLGLAISKALAELHGGTIRAHSDGLGAGATFTIELPVTAPATAAGARPPSDQFAAIRAAILLVEDHADTRRLMQRVLHDAGCDVIAAATMTEALTAAATRRFDLLISDIGLPDGSGIELLQRLRADNRAPVAIALSGYGMEDDIRRSTDAGYASHLTKPVNLRTLSDTVRQLLPCSPAASPQPPL